MTPIEPCAKWRWDALQIELLCHGYFAGLASMMVPNVSWGLRGLGHEADLLILRRSGWLDEVEIKISVSDLRADIKKSHGHKSSLVRYLWFAFPSDMLRAIELVPERAGILIAERKRSPYRNLDVVTSELRLHRYAEPNKDAHKPTTEQIAKLGVLAAHRIWTLKRHARDRAERAERSSSAQQQLLGESPKE